MYMLWTQRAFGPDASGPRVFWSGRIRTKTSGPNTPKIISALLGALGPKVLVSKRHQRRATNSFFMRINALIVIKKIIIIIKVRVFVNLAENNSSSVNFTILNYSIFIIC